MKNLTICFFAIGLTLVAVDGAWAEEEKEYEEERRADLEEYSSKGGEPDTSSRDQEDGPSSGVFLQNDTDGFYKYGPESKGTKPNE